jgi:hypothetical protein
MAQPVETAVRISYPSMFTFLSLISPYLVVLVLLLNTIINSNIKGLIYLFGVIILFFVVFLFQSSINVLSDTTPAYCRLFSSAIPYYSVPSFNSALFLFTFTYVLIPMVSNNVLNLPFITILLVLFAVDGTIRRQNKCTSLLGIFLGGIIGIIIAVLWYSIINSNAPDLLYYDELISNKVACSRPTKQKFKCSVHRNGQLLQSV